MRRRRASRPQGKKAAKPDGRQDSQSSGRKGKRSGQPFIVLTGLSGSGKSQAIRALEDLGYFCVDNLPTMLIPTLARLSLRAILPVAGLTTGISEPDGTAPRPNSD